MIAPMLTLAEGLGSLIGVAIFVIIWVLGALSKVASNANKKPEASPPPQRRGSTGGVPSVTQVSAQDRLRTLSEQRRAQLQEIVRRRTGGGAAPQAPTPMRIERAELDPRPRVAEAGYKREIAEQLQQMQRANEKRQASAPAPRPVATQRSQPAAPPSVRGTKIAPRQVQQQAADIILEPDTIATPLVGRASIGITRQKGRVKIADLSRDRLREAFVLKELLDKPLSLRDEINGHVW